MVTAAEMSAILGVAVSAKDTTHSSGETECQYAAPSGFPTVNLAVDWGDGEIAMRAVNMVNRHEPGIASPYDGIGDQAAAEPKAQFRQQPIADKGADDSERDVGDEPEAGAMDDQAREPSGGAADQ